MEVELFIHTSAITPEHLAVNITHAVNPECALLLTFSFYFSIFICCLLVLGTADLIYSYFGCITTALRLTGVQSGVYPAFAR